MKTLEQNALPVIAIAPVSIADTATATSAAIDTQGFDYAAIIPSMGVGDSALETTVTECATSGGTYTAVNDEESTPAAVAMAHATDDDGTLLWGVLRLDRRERYLKVAIEATGGTASLAQCIVVLFNAQDAQFVSLAPTFVV